MSASRMSWALLVVPFAACGAGTAQPTSAPPASSAATVSWTQPGVSVGPTTRDGSDVASTPTGVVLFGGEKRAFAGTYLDDTWTYSSGSWTRLTLSAHPPALIEGGFAYDPLTNTTLLFGGGDGGGRCTSATWSFSNGRWQQQREPSAPPARYVGGMSYSPVNKGILMFGGAEAGSVAPFLVNDTWLWTPRGWRRLHSATSPPAAPVDGMAADPATGQVVMLTGIDATGATTPGSGETWVWSGANWKRETSAPKPAARFGSAMTYDAAIREVVMFGGDYRPGSPGGSLNDVWGWTGSVWERLTEVNAPPVEVFAGFAYSTSSKRLLLLQADASANSSTWLGKS